MFASLALIVPQASTAHHCRDSDLPVHSPAQLALT